jgi:starvation-inducible outer membrane lipoprotein
VHPRLILALRIALALPVLASSLLLGGCVVVPQNRRAHFADPVMQDGDDALEAHRKRKLYTTREAAAGGDGKTAGGGCSCQ